MRRPVAIAGWLLAVLLLAWPDDETSALAGFRELAAQSIDEDEALLGEPVDSLEEEPFGESVLEIPVEEIPGDEEPAFAEDEEGDAGIDELDVDEDDAGEEDEEDAGEEDEDEVDVDVDVDADEEDVDADEEDVDVDEEDELEELDDLNDSVGAPTPPVLPEGVSAIPAEGVIRGTVVRKRPHAIFIQDRGPRVRVMGTPWDFLAISVGDVVSLPYRTVGDAKWIWPVEPGADRPTADAYSVRGSVEGPITQVDRPRGMIQVGRLWVRSHPADLEAFDEGQIVDVRYVQIDGRLWAHTIELSQR